MKKFIAPVAATAAALSLIAPIAPADAAQLRKVTRDGQLRCQLEFTPGESARAAALKAESYAKTLTNGAEAIAYVDGIEAAVKGAKAVGDKYIISDGVLQVLWEPRGLTTEKSVLVRKAKAHDAAVAELGKLGLAKDAAIFYLRMKEIAQNPEFGENAQPTENAKWFTNIVGGVNLTAAPQPGYVQGRVGETLANRVPSLTTEQRYWFKDNVDKSYYGKVRSELEWVYAETLRGATQCLTADTDVVSAWLPSEFAPNNALPPQQYPKNAQLPKSSEALPVTPPAEKPAPSDAEKPTTPDRPTPQGSNFDAELGKVIGIIAAVLAALGALFGILNALGVEGLPTIPQIPGQWG